MQKIIRSLLFLLIFVSCATTDDPRKGGLVSYIVHGEEAYQKRLEKRKKKLEQLKQEYQEAIDETTQLEKEKHEKITIKHNQLALINKLSDDLEKIKRRVSEYQTTNTSKQKEKQRINKELQLFTKKIEKLKLRKEFSQKELDVLTQKYELLKNEQDILIEIGAEL